MASDWLSWMALAVLAIYCEVGISRWAFQCPGAASTGRRIEGRKWAIPVGQYQAASLFCGFERKCAASRDCS